MRLHEPLPVHAHLVRAAKELGMDEIERADIEARRHAHLAAEGSHALDEIEARPAKIETAVDMRLLDRDEGARIDRFGKADQKPHRECRRAAMHAAGKLPVKVGKFEGHPRQASGAPFDRSMSGARVLRDAMLRIAPQEVNARRRLAPIAA